MPVPDTPPFPARCSAYVGTGRMSYVDVGDGLPIVLLHGNPTSARLYRHLVKALAPQYRCIAPDHLGFGRSDAPPAASYRPPAHATRLEILLGHLDMTNATFVLHDWGGPIGLSYALRHPSRVRRLVLLNTWAWPLDRRPLVWLISRLIGTPAGQWLVEQHNLFARAVMPWTVGPDAPTDWTRPYAAALDSPARRRACWALARSLRTETHWLRALWSDRERLRDVPTLLCWGMQDPAFGSERTLRRWTRLFPNAAVRRLPDIGHYVPEEMGSRLSPLVAHFLDTTAL